MMNIPYIEDPKIEEKYRKMERLGADLKYLFQQPFYNGGLQ